MKQFRWVWILAAAALLLTGIFFFVDRKTKDKEARIEAGKAKTLFAIEPTSTERLVLDNEEGHFEFYVDDATGMWTLDGDDQFNLNTYAVAAINNYFCTLQSEKTVAFDCQDTSVYGFDHPVTLKLYNADTGKDHPYVLYVGDNTPTYDSYYAMVDGSNDVFTIDYTSGSIFCAAKDTLKNLYLFDTYSSLVNYYKVERDGKNVITLDHASGNWKITAPEGMEVALSSITSLMDEIVRVQLDGFVADTPDDLAQYGLDNPKYKLWLKAANEDQTMDEEIWFGNSISDYENETNIYGYFVKSKQVFSIKKASVSFLDYTLTDYISPYCINVSVEDLKSVEIDMGEIYDLHEVLGIDYENMQFKLGDTDITALADDNISELYTDFYRSISNLMISEADPDAVPDPEAEPAITITYTYKDGKQTVLTFTEKADKNYFILQDGVYTKRTVRLNNFTGAGRIVPAYEALMRALK